MQQLDKQADSSPAQTDESSQGAASLCIHTSLMSI